MSFIDSILDKMGLGDDDYYDDDEFYDDDDYEDEKPSKKRGNKRASVKDDDSYDDYENDDEEEDSRYAKGKTIKPNKKVTPINSGGKRRNDEMEVCVIKPTTIEDARQITETLLSGKTVVLNLEGLDIEVAQRIVDFTSGSCFALSGNLQRISNYIFIITPSNVDLFGDFQDILNGTINVSAFRSDDY